MYQNDLSDLITVDELCELLFIGKNAAYRLLNTGEVKAFRIGRVWKIPGIFLSGTCCLNIICYITGCQPFFLFGKFI